MRFFSNEAKDNVEDQDERTGAVPQQRAGSPWQDTPAGDDDAAYRAPGEPAARTGEFAAHRDPSDEDTAKLNDVSRAGSADATQEISGHRVDDGGRRVNDDDSDPDRTTPWDRAGEEDRVADDRAAEEERAERDDTVNTDHDTVNTDHDRVDADRADLDRGDLDRADRDEADAAGGQTPAEKAAEAKAEAEDAKDKAEQAEDAVVDRTIEDRGTFDDPQAVVFDDPRVQDETETGRDEPETVTAPVVEPEPVVAVAAVPAPAAETAENTAISGPAPFFPESDTQPLRDRWRDVQLRFVDDPKASTAEAAALVDETIEKLTTALRQHRGSLASGADDTEALRVELRSYRDILDRLLGL